MTTIPGPEEDLDLDEAKERLDLERGRLLRRRGWYGAIGLAMLVIGLPLIVVSVLFHGSVFIGLAGMGVIAAIWWCSSDVERKLSEIERDVLHIRAIQIGPGHPWRRYYE